MLFIGLSSLAGLAAWFTAMSLQNPAIVKTMTTLGQTEFVVTLLITYFYFAEKINAKEVIGIVMVAVSVFILLASVS